MEHQGLVREGIDALDSFQKDALIKLGKAEHLGGKVVEQLLRDLGCAAGRQICLHHSWAVPEMSARLAMVLGFLRLSCSRKRGSTVRQYRLMR